MGERRRERRKEARTPSLMKYHTSKGQKAHQYTESCRISQKTETWQKAVGFCESQTPALNWMVP